MDRIDREIIGLLSDDARLSYRELGERVFLSANAVAERVRRLVEQEVILGFTTRVDLASLGLPLQAQVEIKLRAGTSAAKFESMLSTIPGIVSATLVTGSFDYLLRIACRDQNDFVRVMEALRAKEGVQDTHSRLVLKDVDLGAQVVRRGL